MAAETFTGNPSQIIVEQLVRSGIKHLFYNSGSREALFFDALYANEGIHGILALHEGSVTAMAGGYSQAWGEPSVISVHLGSGLAQCLGQLINVWNGGLPMVVLTFHGDTGSFADRVALDISHNAGPTQISAPFTKANWTVIEPEGLPSAIERAIMVATTPPMGPVHLAVYDRMLGDEQVTTQLVPGADRDVRAGYPSDDDVEALARGLRDAERPLIYVGDGVWKSGGERAVTALAEHFGASVATMWGDLRGVSPAHPAPLRVLPRARGRPGTGPRSLHRREARRQRQRGRFQPVQSAKSVAAIGSDVDVFKNIPQLDLAVYADERRTVERLNELVRSESDRDRYDDQRAWAREQAAALKAASRNRLQPHALDSGQIGPIALLDAMDSALEQAGGGFITTEQFAVPLECVNAKEDGGSVIYVRPAGGSEGYGMGAPLGAKLAAPDLPVIGLVGDGSVYYADSAFWSAAHHRIPVLYVIPNNGSYGIVAGAFDGAGGEMNKRARYEGVVLDGIDVVGLAESFGVEGIRVDDESRIEAAVADGLETVEKEGRPLLLDVKMPLGLPAGGKAADQYKLVAG